MKRREFLRRSGALAAFGATLGGWQTVVARAAEKLGSTGELACDLVILGGGLGGCACALAACESGLRVILTEETDWIGGQSTAQAVPPDENPWVETFGCTRRYRAYRDGIRAYYRDHFPLTAEARANPRLNPGNGWVSRICHEPRVSLAVLHQMLAPWVSSRRLLILTRHKMARAEVVGDRIRAVSVKDLRAGRERALVAPCFVDATELGDVLPLAKVEYVTGAESRKATGEPHAPETAQPLNQQAFTCCFAMDYLDGENHVIDRPAEYAFWRDYTPEMRPAWPGRLLSWDSSDPITLKRRAVIFDPTFKAQGTNLFSYRRLADPAQFAPGTYAGSISLVNWPQNDYLLGNLVDVSQEEYDSHVARARQLSLSLLYWMQTEAPRPDGGTGWPGLRLREDIVDTPDGLAKHPYIREARRIQAEFTITEPMVGTEARMALTGKSREEVTAEWFPDSVGIGGYRIDLHPSTGGDNYIDLSSLPFQIPLGALLPKRVENLIAACKNIGVTHMTNGAYRLHPVEWNIGEAAGMLAAFCHGGSEPLRAVRADSKRLAAFQQRLRAAGIETAWPRVTPL